MSQTDELKPCCGHCGHAPHEPGEDCDGGVLHDGGEHFHRCLCLNRDGATSICPPLLACAGGPLAYADMYYLQRGHSFARGGVVYTPDRLMESQGLRQIVAYRSRLAETVLRCLAHPPTLDQLARPGQWWGVTADDIRAFELRRTCSFPGCGLDVLENPVPPQTPCSDPECDWEGSGEPCDRHEREMAHAEGDHGLCEAELTCEVSYPSEMLRNGILARAVPGSRKMLAELERRAVLRGMGSGAVPGGAYSGITEEVATPEAP